MEDLVAKIKKIQNKQASLQWGDYKISDNTTIFAVGNKAYGDRVKYFILTSEYGVSVINEESKQELVQQCTDEKDVLHLIISLLKEWFPAKG